MGRAFRNGRLWLALTVLCLCLVLLPGSMLAAGHEDSQESKAAYLSTYFDIDITKEITRQEFADALLKLQPEDGVGAEALTPANPKYGLGALDAVKGAVIGANLEELALVYTSEKAAASLAAAGVTGVPASYAPYVACALDVGLIDQSGAKLAAANQESGSASVISLLMAVADINGVSRNYLGYTDEPGIYAEFVNRWEALTLFDDEKLSSVGAEMVTQKATTGFNLKSSANDARFLPELTLIYGHSDIKHARQLLALLNSEGIVARVQFEPKISIYQYLPEWGAPGEPTPTYEVRTIRDDLMLAYATEYDMVLEFSDPADMAALDRLVLDYAKKNSGEEGKRLLYSSWWQPLYYSYFDMGDGYHKIYDNVLSNGVYSIHPFSLEENRAGVLSVFQNIDPKLEVTQVPIWCDAPFYRYLYGEPE
ncbi:MAG: hypothetical protein LBK98_03785 [Peptococcaceae bacterium]|jgi:hypothetical protein|nr:hypothetical protein [Peptococcaceae bacterium]